MPSKSRFGGWIGLVTLALVACGDDGTSGTGGSSTTGTGASGGTNTGAGGVGAGGEGASGGSGASGGHGGAHSGGAGGQGGSAHGGGHAGGAGGGGGSGHGGGHAGGGGVGGSMGGGGGEGGSGGGGEIAIHGCTSSTAENQTATATVDLTWTNPVAAPNKCIRVSAGTLVRWNGDFGTHPLEGGVSPTSDATSVITLASPAGNVTGVTFTTAGTFPFYCGVHTGSMQGVIYVE